MAIIRINEKVISFKERDIIRDGSPGYDEVEELVQKSELGEALDSLDNDSTDQKTGMSKIDMNSRIPSGLCALTACNSGLTASHFLHPKHMQVVVQLKRDLVSSDGKGREEKVRIAEGQRDMVSGRSMMGKFKGLFTGGQ